MESSESHREVLVAAPYLASVVPPPAIDAGSTAWMLTSSALVLLMIPGLALFYGGMVRRKNILTTMMQSFVAMAVIGVRISFDSMSSMIAGWISGTARPP